MEPEKKDNLQAGEAPKDPVAPESENAGATSANPIPPAGANDEENDEELLKMRGEIADKIKAKNPDDKIYTKSEVDDLLKRFEKKIISSRNAEEEDYIDLLDPNEKKRKFIRVARLNNKFVIGLKDLNTDSYSDQPIYVTNVENPLRKGELIPWATFIYDDGTEELYPYLSFMNRAVGVWAEVIDEKQEDVSKSFGTVDIKEVDDENEWNLKSTGRKVLAKALQFKTTFVVTEIKGKKTLNISEDVVNKVEAPYGDLRNYLDATK